ncbi:unnamed protein product [Macrosiphum euphorbiae]|uniref:Uncharacterized protein n=1 Tax=Macrosiphum euphorbiae TaxID=13131 RepID=A0AAV0VGR1_9HEMI|nr:unnamed protein product [Macrosiphum euphorbiae]
MTTPETANRVPFATIIVLQMMELKIMTELWNVAIPLTYVQKLQDTDVTITDQVVTTNTAIKPIRADHFGNVLKNSSVAYRATVLHV